MNFLTKIAGVTVLGGGIALGAMVTFNGSETLNEAKVTITDYANKLNVFKSNETQLVSKITELRAERDAIQAQIDELLQAGELDMERIAQLETELSEANAQIAELETQISNATSEGEMLAERITNLEYELERANSETEALQQVIDSNKTDVEPMSSEELAQLLGEPIEEPVQEPEIPTEPTEETTEPDPTEYIELTYTKGVNGTLQVAPGVEFYFSTPYYKLQNTSGSSITYQVEGGQVVTVASGNVSSIEGISGSSTNVYVTTVINGQTYRITVIDPNA